MTANKLTLTHKINDLSRALTNQVIDIIRSLTLEELLEITGKEAAPRPVKTRKMRTPRKKKPRKTVAAHKQLTPPAPKAVEVAAPVIAPPSEAPVPEPKRPRVLPPRVNSVPSYRKDIEDRLEKAILSFVKENPGADAGLVSMKLGVPVAKAQSVLDDFVMTGKMTMTSGQHGRCYRVAGASHPSITSTQTIP